MLAGNIYLNNTLYGNYPKILYTVFSDKMAYANSEDLGADQDQTASERKAISESIQLVVSAMILLK